MVLPKEVPTSHIKKGNISEERLKGWSLIWKNNKIFLSTLKRIRMIYVFPLSEFIMILSYLMNEWMDRWLCSWCFLSKVLPGWHVSWTPHLPFPCDFGTPRTDVQAGSKCIHQLWHRGGGKSSPTCNPSGSRSWASTESLAQPAPNWDQIISITTQNFSNNMESNQHNPPCLQLQLLQLKQTACSSSSSSPMYPKYKG